MWDVFLVHVVDLVVDPTVYWFILLLVGMSHVTSFCSLWHPISALISASSLSGSPLWASWLSLIKSLLPFGLSFVIWLKSFWGRPLPVIWRGWVSVTYRRLILSSWSSKHSARATSSGRLELTPSRSRPTLLECHWVCVVLGGEAGVAVLGCSNPGIGRVVDVTAALRLRMLTYTSVWYEDADVC